MARKKSSKPAASSRSARRSEPVAVVEDIEEVEGGMGLEEGVILGTTLALIGALVLVLMAWNQYP